MADCGLTTQLCDSAVVVLGRARYGRALALSLCPATPCAVSALREGCRAIVKVAAAAGRRGRRLPLQAWPSLVSAHGPRCRSFLLVLSAARLLGSSGALAGYWSLDSGVAPLRRRRSLIRVGKRWPRPLVFPVLGSPRAKARVRRRWSRWDLGPRRERVVVWAASALSWAATPRRQRETLASRRGSGRPRWRVPVEALRIASIALALVPARGRFLLSRLRAGRGGGYWKTGLQLADSRCGD